MGRGCSGGSVELAGSKRQGEVEVSRAWGARSSARGQTYDLILLGLEVRAQIAHEWV